MKIHTMVTLDAPLMEKARGSKINLSGLLNDALLKKFGEIEDESNPEVKEKHLKEKILTSKLEIENRNKEILEADQELKNLEKAKIEYAEKARQKAIEAAARYKKNIHDEIHNNWPEFIRRNELSTKRKQEALYKKRAAYLGISIDQYRTDVVDIATAIVTVK